MLPQAMTARRGVQSMDTFGFCIIQTLVTDIEPAAKVKAAMNEINAATRMRAAAAQKAEAEKIQVLPPAHRTPCRADCAGSPSTGVIGRCNKGV